MSDEEREKWLRDLSETNPVTFEPREIWLALLAIFAGAIACAGLTASIVLICEKLAKSLGITL